MTHKLEFWGQTIWGSEEFGWKTTSENKSWFDSTLKKSFTCLSISPKLSGQLSTWLKIVFIKCGGCGIPDFTATPIFSANLHWHATGTHCILSMISLHSLEALKNVFRLIHNSIKLNYQHISIKKYFYCQQWILRSDNLRSMKHLDEKWPQRAKVELIQT